MLRKIQIYLIRAIAAGRPVMLNVHISGQTISVLGDGAHIENVRIESVQVQAIRIAGSDHPRFNMGPKPSDT